MHYEVFETTFTHVRLKYTAKTKLETLLSSPLYYKFSEFGSYNPGHSILDFYNVLGQIRTKFP